MSLSCLRCGKLQRCDSDRDPLAPALRRWPSSVAHRNWSGCLVWVPPPASQGQHHGNNNAVRFRALGVPRDPSRWRLQKLASASAVEIESEAAAACNGPRLRRSGGMRRDWSFEDLNKNVIVVSMS